MYHGEKFNAYSHLIGTLLAISGSIFLIYSSLAARNLSKTISFIIYGLSLILLYSFSTLYHSTRGNVKKIFQKLDHDSIYLLIAGTYTPFTLVSLKGSLGWQLFFIIWALAIAGIIQEHFFKKGSRKLSLIIYLLMGWFVLMVTKPLIEAISLNGFIWLAAGGCAYTGGILFYIYDEKFRHWHGIWHIFVIAGSVLHYCAVFNYVL